MMSLKVKMSYTLKSHSPAGHIFHIRLGNQRVGFKKREKAKTKNDNLICLENLFIYLPPCCLLQLVTADGCSSLSLVLPVKSEFLLLTVAKCLLIWGRLIVLGFLSAIVGSLPFNIKHLRAAVVVI